MEGEGGRLREREGEGGRDTLLRLSTTQRSKESIPYAPI